MIKIALSLKGPDDMARTKNQGRVQNLRKGGAEPNVHKKILPCPDLRGVLELPPPLDTPMLFMQLSSLSPVLTFTKQSGTYM